MLSILLEIIQTEKFWGGSFLLKLVINLKSCSKISILLAMHPKEAKASWKVIMKVNIGKDIENKGMKEKNTQPKNRRR